MIENNFHMKGCRKDSRVNQEIPDTIKSESGDQNMW